MYAVLVKLDKKQPWMNWREASALKQGGFHASCDKDAIQAQDRTDDADESTTTNNNPLKIGSFLPIAIP